VFEYRTMTRVQKIATIIALAICFAVAISMEVREASNTPHEPINQSATSQPERKADNEARKERPDEAIARYNWWLTLFTAVLAVATVVLGLATVGLYVAGERQLRHVQGEAAQARRRRWEDQLALSEQLSIARQNSEAAKKSADAAVAVDRARFFPVIEHNFLDCVNAVQTWDGQIPDSQQLASSNWPMAKINFKNYGKTPGIISSVSTAIMFSTEPPDPVFDEKIVTDNIIDAGKLSEDFPTVISHPITLGEAKKVKRGEGNIWVFGNVMYSDVFGEAHIHRFCQRLVGIGAGFRYVLQSYDHKNYNCSS
jgi:hypothetical protein